MGDTLAELLASSSPSPRCHQHLETDPEDTICLSLYFHLYLSQVKVTFNMLKTEGKQKQILAITTLFILHISSIFPLFN